MLILTRRVGETLVIGDDITITVLGINGHQVRLGINAPKEVPVHREEIYTKIQHEKSLPDDKKLQLHDDGKCNKYICKFCKTDNE